MELISGNIQAQRFKKKNLVIVVKDSHLDQKCILRYQPKTNMYLYVFHTQSSDSTLQYLGTSISLLLSFNLETLEVINKRAIIRWGP